jgi:outer membrane protein assembly factor BamA
MHLFGRGPLVASVSPLPWRRVLACLLALVCLTNAAQAESPQADPKSARADGPPNDRDPNDPPPAIERAELELGAPSDITALRGKPLLEVVLRERGSSSDRPLSLRHVRSGESFSAAVTRRAMNEVLEEGGYAELTAEAEALGDGVRLRLIAVLRKTIVDIDISGGLLDHQATLEVAGVAAGDEITQTELGRVEQRVRDLYRRRGFPSAEVKVDWQETSERIGVLVRLTLQPGPPNLIGSRRFDVEGAVHPELRQYFDSYAVAEQQRADDVWLDDADRAFEVQLSRRGWFRAQVSHELLIEGDHTTLRVLVEPGSHYRVRVEGNETFDSAQLLDALELEAGDEPTEQVMASKIREFYVDRGFLDVGVAVEERRGPLSTDRVLIVRENRPVRIVGRTYPCLVGETLAEQANEEIDGVLSELLPGGDDWVGPPSSEDIDRTIASRGGQRVDTFVPTPWQSYAPDAYDKALGHLSDLYRSEGYLSAGVGPISVLRRACDRLSPPGRCEPVGVRVAPASTCPSVTDPFPVEDPDPDPGLTCVPDPTRGVYCELNVVLSIPVKLGPRTTLWNLEFAGNERILEHPLAAAAALELGAPVSQVELQKARRRLLDLYADEGYAFAGVELELRLSQDQTRGSARFVISERERVEVSAIVVRGAAQTSESLILGRLELSPGGVYRRSAVRQSEEQLATLGVFSSVTIGLEDPEVPSKRKVVVVDVVERLPQYVDIKPGFSTGEGARAAFEYGHRNLAGKAVQLRFRVQLGYLPGILIFENDVRRSFDQLSFADRLERRNTVTLEFPVGKQYRLAFDGVDARDNSRDFGITKRAVIVTLTHRPSRWVSLLTGSSFELNDARVFGDTQTLQDYLEVHPEQVRLLNVPEGRSFAVAVRAGGTWDRTDNPLGPTRGTLLSAEVEPVVAYLDDDSAAVQLVACQGAGNDPATCDYKSRFLKFTNRVAGYLPLTSSGLSLALSVRWGANFQLVEHSSTYPDRLFFLGGGESLRGFLQASVIPQDIADQLQAEDPTAPDQEDRLTARKVVIRGGDFILNPRAELRIPLTKVFHTAIFLDTGNVWRDIRNVDPTELRYSAGSGLRFITPVGPLAFDYGFKLDRRFYESDVGAFHFSVGLF